MRVRARQNRNIMKRFWRPSHDLGAPNTVIARSAVLFRPTQVAETCSSTVRGTERDVHPIAGSSGAASGPGRASAPGRLGDTAVRRALSRPQDPSSTRTKTYSANVSVSSNAQRRGVPRTSRSQGVPITARPALRGVLRVPSRNPALEPARSGGHDSVIRHLTTWGVEKSSRSPRWQPVV
jgi:hypothetical protein